MADVSVQFFYKLPILKNMMALWLIRSRS